MRRLLLLPLLALTSLLFEASPSTAVDGARSVIEMRAIIVRFGELSACVDHGWPVADFPYLQNRVTRDADRNEIAMDTRDLLWGTGREEFESLENRSRDCLSLRATLMGFYPRTN